MTVEPQLVTQSTSTSNTLLGQAIESMVKIDVPKKIVSDVVLDTSLETTITETPSLDMKPSDNFIGTKDMNYASKEGNETFMNLENSSGPKIVLGSSKGSDDANEKIMNTDDILYFDVKPDQTTQKITTLNISLEKDMNMNEIIESREENQKNILADTSSNTLSTEDTPVEQDDSGNHDERYNINDMSSQNNGSLPQITPTPSTPDLMDDKEAEKKIEEDATSYKEDVTFFNPFSRWNIALNHPNNFYYFSPYGMRYHHAPPYFPYYNIPFFGQHQPFF